MGERKGKSFKEANVTEVGKKKLEKEFISAATCPFLFMLIPSDGVKVNFRGKAGSF